MLTFNVQRLAAWYYRRQLNPRPTKQNQRLYEPNKVKKLPERALIACSKLQDVYGRDLRNAVQATLQLYEGPRYEPVTPQEFAAIKTAMVSG